jgi:RNA polymerase sigma-70 factor (ECF subfamily)
MAEDLISDLLQKVAREDRAAFRALYAEAGAKLMGVVMRILKDRSEAEDALQETFTRVWLKARAFDPARGSGLSWLVALARNLAIDRLRARAPLSEDDTALDVIADPAPRAEARLVAKGEARRITDCLDTLEADRAQAVRGAYLNGDSYQDLALRFDVPMGTMRTWLRRSLIALRECMEA